jgi:hypothetical protein
MANPTCSVSLDRPTPSIGQVMTLTVAYGDPDQKRGTVTVTVTDAENNTSAPQTVAYVVDPLTITLVDSLSNVWTKVSDSGTVAIYTHTA